MDQTPLLVIFLACIGFTVITNTVMIWFAYKAFAKVTTRVTQAVHEFGADVVNRERIVSLEKMASQAAVFTETTKRKMKENDPVLEELQTRFEYTLAKIDIRVERFTEAATENAIRVCDAVVKPAKKIGAVADGLHNALGSLSPNSDEN